MKNCQGPLYAWKQTRIYSCGPACLMTALAEYGRSGMSEKTELEIWGEVRNMLFMGSTPAYLARCAKNRGLSTGLFKRSWPGTEKTPGRTVIHRILHRHLLRVYRNTARDYEAQGNEAYDYAGEREVLEALMAGPELKAIYLIVDQDEIFHFVLARPDGSKISVMDPAFGTNTLFTQDGFLADFENRMLGYCLMLGPDSQPFFRTG